MKFIESSDILIYCNIYKNLYNEKYIDGSILIK